MQLISALAAGVRGAEQGFARVYRRGTSERIAWFEDFEGTATRAPAEDIPLDVHGSAVVYLEELAEVRVFTSDYAQVRLFVEGSTAAAVEVASVAFTGADYETALSGTTEPTTLSSALDLWLHANGAPDWEVRVNGANTTIAAALATVVGLLVNVKSPEFGAVGDGVADDTTAIQDAVDAAAAAGGGCVAFPPGQYRITGTILLSELVSLMGVGSQLSRILVDTGATSGVSIVASDTRPGELSISGLALEPNYDMSALTLGVLVNHASGVVDLTIRNCYLGSSTHRVDGLVRVGAISETTRLRIIDSKLELLDGVCVNASETFGQVIATGTEFVFRNATPGRTGIGIHARRSVTDGCHFNPTPATAGDIVFVRVENALGQASIAGSSSRASGGATPVYFCDGTSGATVALAGNLFPGTTHSLPQYTGTNTDHGSQWLDRVGRHGSGSSNSASPTFAADRYGSYTHTNTAVLATLTVNLSLPLMVGQRFTLTLVAGSGASMTILAAGTNVDEIISRYIHSSGILSETISSDSSNTLVFEAQRKRDGTLVWVNVARAGGTAF